MSQLPAREEAKSPLSHDHWLSEQLLDWAHIGVIHIRPTFFAEDLYLFTAGDIARGGKMNLPFGKGKHAPVIAADIARIVAGLLTDPAQHVGKRYVLTGPHNLSLNEIARTVGTGLGIPVEYVDVPIDFWRNSLVEKAGFPDYLVTHLAAAAQDHQDGVFSVETDAIEKIGGQAPQSVDAFVRSHAAAF